jgi:hypothetical protein
MLTKLLLLFYCLGITLANLRGATSTVESIIRNMKDHAETGTCAFDRKNLLPFHPDKGGSPEDSKKVLEQYNLYRDICKRKKATGSQKREEKSNTHSKEQAEQKAYKKQKRKERQREKSEKTTREKATREKERLVELVRSEQEAKAEMLNKFNRNWLKGYSLYDKQEMGNVPGMHRSLAQLCTTAGTSPWNICGQAIQDGYAAASLDFQEEYTAAIDMYNKASRGLSMWASKLGQWSYEYTKGEIRKIADMYERRAKEITDYLD